MRNSKMSEVLEWCGRFGSRTGKSSLVTVFPMAASEFDASVMVPRALAGVAIALRDPAERLWLQVAVTLTRIIEAADLENLKYSAAPNADRADMVDALDSLQKLADVCDQLRDFLFDRVERMVFDGESSPRICVPIQFVPRSSLAELTSYLANPEVGSEFLAAVTWASPTALAFVRNWIDEIREPVRTGSKNAGEFGPDLYVTDAPDSTSARTAFNAWAVELQNISDSLRLAPALAEVTEAAARATKAATAVESTAGGAAANVLSKHFSGLAADERKRALWWSIAAIVILFVATGVALFVLTEGSTTDKPWSQQLLHLALAVPLTLLAGYSSQVASRHRHQAWWAGTTAAQLNTIETYSLALTPDERSPLLLHFGHSVFAHPVFDASNYGVTESASLTTALEKVLDRLVTRDASSSK